MKAMTITFVIIRFALGGMMLWGGYQKFAKPIPNPLQIIEQIEKEGTEKLREDINTLKIRNYIFGLKQTDYFWQLLGVCEILFGLMLISQFMGFAGAVMLIPITLHIFLFHLFLEPDDTNELIQTGLLFFANMVLVAKEFPKWKMLVWIKPF